MLFVLAPIAARQPRRGLETLLIIYALLVLERHRCTGYAYGQDIFLDIIERAWLNMHSAFGEMMEEAVSDQESVSAESVKLQQGRSPAYPYIPLGKAMERARLVYDAGVGRNAYPPGTFYKVWGIGAKSSGARQTMAALNHFGLVDYEGRGNDRKVRLSDLALKIIRDKRPESPERQAAIQRAAVVPPIHKKLLEKFPPPQPDDVFIEHYLVDEAGYNESAAKSLISEFKDTLAFAKLDQPDKMPTPDEDEADRDPDSDHEQLPVVSVGDLIQWTSGGVDQFPTPATVMGLSDDGEWVFTDQGTAGIPVSEVIVVEQANQDSGSGGRAAPPTPPHILAQIKAAQQSAENAPPPEGARKAIFPVSEGDVTLIFPKGMTAEALAELGDYLDVFLKKEKRKASSSEQNARR